MKLRPWVFIPDCHHPFCDVKAYRLLIKVMVYIENTYGLRGLCILGDFLDLYGLSFWEKDDSLGSLSELYDREMAVGNTCLDEFDTLFPKAQKIFIEGNHEFRLKKYINKYAGALRNRLSVVTELNLDKRSKWTWVPYTKLQKVQIDGSPLYARHEPFGSSQPKTQAAKSGDSFIYGHTHQVGEGHYITKLTGRDVVAINAGSLIDMKAKVFDYVKNRPDWKHAFVVAWVNKETFHVQIIRINKDYTCMFDGKLFK